jgi:hypothetical protein
MSGDRSARVPRSGRLTVTTEIAGTSEATNRSSLSDRIGARFVDGSGCPRARRRSRTGYAYEIRVPARFPDAEQDLKKSGWMRLHALGDQAEARGAPWSRPPRAGVEARVSAWPRTM